MKKRALLLIVSVLAPLFANAAKFIELKVLDKDYLMLLVRDGEIRYRDNGTGPSAFLGHSFAEGDDTLMVFGQHLNPETATIAAEWTVSSADDRHYGSVHPVNVWRRSKPMQVDHTLASELDHWLYLQLPKPMKQGCTYTVSIPLGVNADVNSCKIKFDINQNMSEAIHVNIIGYTPDQPVKAADLYLWMGDGGQRDYTQFQGKKVWLYNVNTGKRRQVGNVTFWKAREEYRQEANRKDDTGSDVWNIDFKCSTPGRYRLIVEDVGCSMDFDIRNDVYYEPYRYADRQENRQLNDFQAIGDGNMKGNDFRQMAAAYLYNVTGQREWEDIMAQLSIVTGPDSKIWNTRQGYQIWGTAAYLNCPQERHYPKLYRNMKSSVALEAETNHVSRSDLRPSRRTTNDSRWQTSENLQLVMMAHFLTLTA